MTVVFSSGIVESYLEGMLCREAHKLKILKIEMVLFSFRLHVLSRVHD
jgi:hypothetical protein